MEVKLEYFSLYFCPFLDSYPYYNPYMSSMYIRKAKDDEDYNEEAEEKFDPYPKPTYWNSENSKTQDPESDYKGFF